MLMTLAVLHLAATTASGKVSLRQLSARCHAFCPFRPASQLARSIVCLESPLQSDPFPPLTSQTLPQASAQICYFGIRDFDVVPCRDSSTQCDCSNSGPVCTPGCKAANVSAPLPAGCAGTCVPKKPAMCRQGGNIKPIDCAAGYKCAKCIKSSKKPDVACTGVCMPKASKPKPPPPAAAGAMCREGGNIMPVSCEAGYACTNCTKAAGSLPDVACIGVCAPITVAPPPPAAAGAMCREGGNIMPVACEAGYACTNCTKAGSGPRFSDVACIGVCAKGA